MSLNMTYLFYWNTNKFLILTKVILSIYLVDDWVVLVHNLNYLQAHLYSSPICCSISSQGCNANLGICGNRLRFSSSNSGWCSTASSKPNGASSPKYYYYQKCYLHFYSHTLSFHRKSIVIIRSHLFKFEKKKLNHFFCQDDLFVFFLKM